MGERRSEEKRVKKWENAKKGKDWNAKERKRERSVNEPFKKENEPGKNQISTRRKQLRGNKNTQI